VGFIILALFTLAIPAYAGAPLEVVKANLNKALEVLNDPKLKADSGKEIKTQKLRAIYREMVNEVEFSRRTLGRHWNQFTPAQRAEFVDLFEQVLEKAYVDQIFTYTDERIEYTRENMLTDTMAEVQTKIITSSKEIPVFYRLSKRDGQWRVYDVVVENVSMVQNYRTQFNDILAKNKPEHLLDVLRKRVKEK